MAKAFPSILATRVDSQTAASFRAAMARAGSTPSAFLRAAITAALTGPRLAPPASPAPAPASAIAEAA